MLCLMAKCATAKTHVHLLLKTRSGAHLRDEILAWIAALNSDATVQKLSSEEETFWNWIL